jgi:penicillin-binding protein 2
MNGERLLKRRFIALTSLFAGSITVLILYLFTLQIVRGFEYSQRARDVSQREVAIPAQRGKIFDRNGDIPLVSNVDSFAVDVIPGDVKTSELPGLFVRLSRILSIPVSEIEKRIPPKNYHLFQPLEVKGGVSLQTISYLAEHIDEFTGVSWHNKQIRSYPEGGTLAHVIGYVGNINEEELQVLYNEGYDPDSALGKSGIEKQYDRILRGKNGTSYRVVDVKERSLSTDEERVIPPIAGQDIVLTIDARIQDVAEKALGARRGSVVVMKPATGEILALVSYPSFDPNKLYTTEASSYSTQLSLDPSAPFLDRAIQSAYPPGSAFKILMTTAVIDDATIPIGRNVLCTGKLVFGDRVFNCHVKTGHGYLDLFGGLAQSCDVYFYTVGNELGVEKIDSYGRDFGLGALTGIDLPEEKSGLLPTPEWKEKTQHMSWVGGDTVNFSIGQGFLTITPLQMADMVALIANEGTVYRPHLLKETRDPATGKIIETTRPEVIHTSHVSPETFRMVQDAMRGVITKGTAAPVVDTKVVEIAGKTGTSEVGIEGSWHSWFAAFAPYKTDNPEDRIVVVVMVEASDNWEWWAPKASNLIFQCIFANQSYEQAVAALRPWYIPVKKGAE